MTTKVVATCIKKSQSQSWNKDNPIQHTIELALPYDNNDIYFMLSGGTTINLMTINQQAADGFEVGKKYKINIAPDVE